MSINVCWVERPEGGVHARSSYSCCHMLNQLFDLYQCEHWSGLENLPETSGAVVVLHGGHAALGGLGSQKANYISRTVSRLDWTVFVNIGDEASEFPNEELRHPNSLLWLQTPLPSQKARRFLIEGFPDKTIRVECVKDLDFFFAGQNTHDRRHACTVTLRAMTLEDRFKGSALFTDSFGAGYEQEKYLEMMSRAKVVPCPSGPASPDTFRIWEALECGAVPIVDARSLRDETIGFWPLVLGNHPLPMIDDWSALPERMEEILSDYERTSRMCQHFWRFYKMRFRNWLAEDLLSLGAR